MSEVTETIFVNADPEAVWEVLADPHYIPRLYPDMLNIKLEPDGRVVPGQLRTLTGRAGKRTIEFKTKVTDVAPQRRLVIEGRSGGAFEMFSQVVELAKAREGTEVRVTFRFKVSLTYFGVGFDPLGLGRMAEANERTYIKNLKELSELQRV